MAIEFYPLQMQFYLEMELKKRKQRRPHYSLRAFARDLEIGASTLSEILSGKAGLSLARIQQLSKKLNLSESQSNHWYDLVVINHSKDPNKIKKAKKRLNEKKLDEALFQLISDWYYLAILEIIEIEPQMGPDRIAKVLGLNKSICSKAINSMIKLGFMYHEDGVYRSALTDITVNSELPSQALGKFHLQTLKKAQRAIVNQTRSERDFQSLVFSLRKDTINDFKKELFDQIIPIVKKYEAQNKKNAVYNFSYQLFE